MRSSRLVSLLMLLEVHRRLSASRIAQQLGVSLRTVYRDVDALMASGVPIYAEPGRGGGYRLVDGYRTNLTGLATGEAAALFLVGLPAPAEALGLADQAAAAELKLLAALGPVQRERAARLRDRFHLDIPAWYTPADNPQRLPELADAVLQDRRLDITYRRWQEPREVQRVVDPYGLVLKNGTWYLLAGDRSPGTGEHGGVRTYRVSNVLSATSTGAGVTRPEGFDLAKAWQQQLTGFDERRFIGEAVLRLSAVLIPRLADLSAWWLLRAVEDSPDEPDPAGNRTVRVPIESAGHAAARLIPFGGEVKVLAPAELRDAMVELAQAALAHYC